MTSISWNDIEGEDSSLSDISSGVDQINKELQETAKLKKITSNPFPKASEHQLQKRENLEKLQNHKSQKVWVYSPNFYKQREVEVNKIINNIQYLEAEVRKNQGWNICVKVQKAKKLIQQGYQSSGMKLKFIYSILNNKIKQEKRERHKGKGNQDRKGFVSPKNKFEKASSTRNIKSRQKPVYKEKATESEVKDKKKVKYIAKEVEPQTQQKINKMEEQETIPQIKSPQENSNHNEGSQIFQRIAEGEQQLKEKRKQEEEESQESKQTSLQNKIQSSKEEEKQQAKEIEIAESDRDSEESLKEMKKQIQKKKKKPKGKKKNKKKEVDSNNPFSYFDQ